ncbi:MAG: hypothetical protein K2F81_03850 [Ruminococcus sp.]|nr:hypothetical protein [Ruminococcus sp.]
MESNDFILTDELLEKVNKFSRAKLAADEIYTFPVILCDNEVDRDYERFSIDALRKLAELFIGKTGIFDHNPKGENQTARIFDTEVKVSTDRITSAGEPYAYLSAKAYMIRTAKSADLIAEIDGGIKKEVSVSCSVKSHICSICGADMKKSPCTHIKGAEYGGKICSYILNDPFDAYEWSFVAIPAQKNAGVTKTYDNKYDKDYAALKSELAQAKKENFQAREMLKKEILRLSFLYNPLITVKTVGFLTNSLSFNQLLELKENLEQDLKEKEINSKGKTNTTNKNINEFKITKKEN